LDRIQKSYLLDIFFNLWIDPKYTDFVISLAIGPYYFDKHATPAIDQDAGYWVLDTGLTKYSVDFK
jgi:hypothetical protein